MASFPSPIKEAISALPPVFIIVAKDSMTPKTGIVIFTAASPAVPTARATRTPSMMK